MRNLLILLLLLTLSSCKATTEKTEGDVVPRKENTVEQLYFSVGDEFKNYEILDSKGNALEVSEISNKKTLIFFAWHLCPDCHEVYEDYKEIFKTYENNEELDLCFIWDNEIPHSDFIGIVKEEQHYTADDKYKFTENVPAYFIVDEKDTIIFKSTDTRELIDLLLKEYGEEIAK